MTVTRYRGHAWTCDLCSRTIKAETIVVLELNARKHREACEAKRERSAAATAATAAQPGLFDLTPKS